MLAPSPLNSLTKNFKHKLAEAMEAPEDVCMILNKQLKLSKGTKPKTVAGQLWQINGKTEYDQALLLWCNLCLQHSQQQLVSHLLGSPRSA